MDVIREALELENEALLSIRLHMLFTGLRIDSDLNSTPNGPGWPTLKNRLLTALELAAIDDSNLTIGWILDSRVGGRRWYALQDALRPRNEPLWPGFPWKPPPPT